LFKKIKIQFILSIFILIYSSITFSFDGKPSIRFKHLTIEDGLPQNAVLTILQGRAGFLWIGTTEGLVRYDGYNLRVFKYDLSNSHSLSDNYIRNLLQDTQGNLWVGTRTGLNHFNIKTEKFTHYRHQADDGNSLSDDNVSSLLEDSQGNLWVGTRGGLNHFNPKTKRFTHYRHQEVEANSLSNDDVYSLFEDSQENLWVGTYTGLNLFNKTTGKFKRFTTINGLPNNVIYSIEEDNQGDIWLSTNQGLSRMEPKTETFRNYDVADGLQSNEFNIGASFKSSSGVLFFGGINGFNRFNPENISDDEQIPIVLITDMLLLNESVAIVPLATTISSQNQTSVESTEAKNLRASSSSNTDDEMTDFVLNQAIHETKAIALSHKDNIVAFEFAALHFSNPKKNQFAYQLVGWDKGWVETDYKNRRATYTNLPSGSYTFRIKASNADGYWNEKGASLEVTVLPPPWKTWWAYTLYGLLLLSVLLVFIRSQQKKVFFERNINAQLEYKVAERTSELKTQKNEVDEKNKEILATQKQLIQSSKMASIGTMTAGVAHEINNPTNFAHAAAYMMKDEIIKIKTFLKQLAGGDKASPEVLQSFDEQFTKLIELTNTTSEGTTRIKTIVEDLRTFARIDDAKQAEANVNDLINSTVHLVQTQYDSVVIETKFD